MATPMRAAAEPGDGFFATLPDIVEFRHVAERQRYRSVPDDWQVVVTDIRGSTRAIEEGRYRDVNALGVASIVAVRNATPDLELPYVFGGDGATLLVPSSRLEACRSALRGVRRLARDCFDLELRVGLIPVAELRAAGHAVLLARYRPSAHICLAMFAGDGFNAAERWLKDVERGRRYELGPEGDRTATFDGFECRWRPVPSQRGAVVSLLVTALSHHELERDRVYRDVIDGIEAIAGGADVCPVSLSGLRLRRFRDDYTVEARVRSGEKTGPAFDAAFKRARDKAQIGRVLVTLGATAGGFDGSRYPGELVENTDFQKFDETLRMVLDLSLEEADEVQAFLERERARGRLAYGVHRATAALVTCYVRAYSGDHVHFVDGADGGYALAAKHLKAQLAESR